MRKKTLFLAMMMAAVLAGCGGGKGPQGTEGKAPASTETSGENGAKSTDKTKLTMLMYGSAEQQEKLKEVIKPFEEENNCTVDIILSSLADYDQKLTTMIAGGTAPDAFWVAEYAVPQYYQDGLMADLTELLNDGEYDFSDFTEAQQNHYLYDGKLVGAPFSGAPLVCFYNKSLIEKAGLETPTELYKKGEWTVDAMIGYARKLTDASNNTYGIDFSRGGDWANWDVCMTPVLKLYGGEPWSEDYKTIGINSEKSLQGVQTFYDLITVDKAHPAPGTTIDFKAGQLALFPDLFSNVKKMVDLDFEWDVVPMPFNEDGKSTGWSGSAGYAAYSEGKNLELSKKFVRFITSKEIIEELMHYFVPTRSSVLESEDYRTGNQGEIMRPSEESFTFCITDTIDKVRVKSPHPQYNNISQVILEHLEEMYSGVSDPKEAVDAMADGMEEYMVK